MKRIDIPTSAEALPGREEVMQVASTHYVNGHALKPPFPEGLQQAMFGIGCFWGAERRFWELAGVYSTAVGYAAGSTPNPTYEEVCSGMTGHNEVVLVILIPPKIRLKAYRNRSGKAMIPPRVCVREMIKARNIALGFILLVSNNKIMLKRQSSFFSRHCK